MKPRERLAAPVAACARCGVTWGGLARCHCSACHLTFSALSYFDQHRWHKDGRDGCWHPSELSTRGQPLVCRDGIWGGPELSAEQKARLFRRVEGET